MLARSGGLLRHYQHARRSDSIIEQSTRCPRRGALGHALRSRWKTVSSLPVRTGACGAGGAPSLGGLCTLHRRSGGKLHHCRWVSRNQDLLQQRLDHLCMRSQLGLLPELRLPGGHQRVARLPTYTGVLGQLQLGLRAVFSVLHPSARRPDDRGARRSGDRRFESALGHGVCGLG